MVNLILNIISVYSLLNERTRRRPNVLSSHENTRGNHWRISHRLVDVIHTRKPVEIFIKEINARNI